MRSAARSRGRRHEAYMLHYAARSAGLRSPLMTDPFDPDAPPHARGATRSSGSSRSSSAAACCTSCCSRVDVSRSLWTHRAHRVAAVARSPRSRSTSSMILDQRVALGAAARARSTSTCRSAAGRTRTWSRRSSTTFCRRTSAATSSASATPRSAPGSKTLAATVVLVDRGHRAARPGVRRGDRRDDRRARQRDASARRSGRALGGAGRRRRSSRRPAVLMPHGVGRAAAAARALHQEWVEERIERLTAALAKFREAPRRARRRASSAPILRAGDRSSASTRRSRAACTSTSRSRTSPSSCRCRSSCRCCRCR